MWRIDICAKNGKWYPTLGWWHTREEAQAYADALMQRKDAPPSIRVKEEWPRQLTAIEQQWRDQHELEQQAGIGDAAGRAWEGPLFPRGAFSNAEFGSDEWKRISEMEDEDEDRYIRYGIRRAYFSVVDLDLRKALINGEREIHSAWQDIVRKTTVVAAEGKLTATKYRRAAPMSWPPSVGSRWWQ